MGAVLAGASAAVTLRREATVAGLRPAEHVIVEADSETHPYDRLLLATGSRPRVPRGFVGPGVSTPRTLDDARQLVPGTLGVASRPAQSVPVPAR
ncbi:hypothetical protein [Streptomyces tendae]